MRSSVIIFGCSSGSPIQSRARIFRDNLKNSKWFSPYLPHLGIVSVPCGKALRNRAISDFRCAHANPHAIMFPNKGKAQDPPSHMPYVVWKLGDRWHPSAWNGKLLFEQTTGVWHGCIQAYVPYWEHQLMHSAAVFLGKTDFHALPPHCMM